MSHFTNKLENFVSENVVNNLLKFSVFMEMTGTISGDYVNGFESFMHVWIWLGYGWSL